MKISREQVAENRKAILEAGARLFRERGFDGVTVAEVMQAAGLTHGAFYGYFTSKDDLVVQAFGHVLGTQASDGSTPEKLTEVAARYLHPAHRDDPGHGCLLAALGSESSRASADVRHTLTGNVRERIALFSKDAPGKTAEEKRRAAIGSWSAMVGAVTLARLVDDAELSDAILEETLAWLNARK